MVTVNLNPEKALIFRIVHRENVVGMLRDGLHCRNSAVAAKPFVQIGNPDLIEKRRHRLVDCSPGGTLSDYIPFYFTPYSPMMYNIHTGYNGIVRRHNEDIVIVVSSLHHLVLDQVEFVFSDRHANLKLAQFSSDLQDLDRIDWPSLRARNFRKDDVDRFERYQAEALVYKKMPVASLMGIVSHCDSATQEITKMALKAGHYVKFQTLTGWYF